MEAFSIKSTRLLYQVVEGVHAVLPGSFRELLGSRQRLTYRLSPLLPLQGNTKSVAGGKKATASKKAAQKEGGSERPSLWSEGIGVAGELGPSFSLRGCRRSQYKPPIEKRIVDLQWRIIHRLIATNRYVSLLDPSLGRSCLFCGDE